MVNRDTRTNTHKREQEEEEKQGVLSRGHGNTSKRRSMRAQRHVPCRVIGDDWETREVVEEITGCCEAMTRC